ncbi:MAG TPA: hypothetical protein VFA20_04395 [Myxococcaceae bacterium]|nr:hypothetical protein [Myxococcaceae bacterium]
MSDEHAVFVAVTRPDGNVEQVQVGTATRQGDGFVLRLGEMTIGGSPVRGGASAGSGAGSYAPAPARSGGGSSGPLPTALPNYGRSKGAPIRGASQGDLEFYANGARRSLADPSKARFHDKERALLEAIDQELQRQRGGGGGGEGGGPEEPPPPGDEDAPF